MPLDPNTDVGRVRLLITDSDDANRIFLDAEIEAFLAMEGGSVKLAAAQALDTIGTNQALVLKVIRVMDLQTDGAALSRELRQRAKELRDRADDEGGFDIAEIVVNDFAYRERIFNELLREG